MAASLAEQLQREYARGRWTDTWDEMSSRDRAAWERVADVAREQCQSAIVGYRCACGIDHTFETREQVAEQLAEVTRQRDEAQRAVRDGFPATVAVIRQQRDEAQQLADRRNDLLALIKAETGAYVGAQVHELAKAEAVIAKVEAILARARTA